MIKWLVAIAALAILAGTVTIQFHYSNTAYTHRYRLTVSADCDGTKYTGSNVVEVTWLQQSQNLPIRVPIFVANVRGDATFVNLGNGRALVGLLGPADALDIPTAPEFRVMRAFNLPDGNQSIPLLAELKGVRRLEGDNLPALVFFSDITDPASARVVKPSSQNQELAPGLRFLEATIEVTSDPITREIDKQLPWWSNEGRPAVVAWRAWLQGKTAGFVGPETLFRKG